MLLLKLKYEVVFIKGRKVSLVIRRREIRFIWC